MTEAEYNFLIKAFDVTRSENAKAAIEAEAERLKILATQSLEAQRDFTESKS